MEKVTHIGAMSRFSDREYALFRDLLIDRIGLYFGEKKRRDLAIHLAAAMKQAAILEPKTYYAKLYIEPLDSALWTNLINRLTVDETYFFRNPAHFTALQKHILPCLIQRRRESGHLVLRLWSAGCATGEEPYSLAVTLLELLPDVDAWSIMILATDINSESLAYAAKGVYGQRSFRNDTPPNLRDRYFRPNGQGLELLPEVRRMVHFAYLNLVEATYPSAASFTLGVDLIMCRNVTIYFDQATTRQVVGRFHGALADDGWLIVGYSEPLAANYRGFQPCNLDKAVVYQKASMLAALASTSSSPHHHSSGTTHTSTSDQPRHAAMPISLQTFGPPSESARQVEAQRPVTQPSAIDETSAQSCYEAGKSFADRMQWVEAHEWLARALAHEPLLLEAHFTRALVYERQGDDQAALEALKRTLYIDRDFVLGHFALGVLHHRLGHTGEALRAWRIAQGLLQRIPPDEPLHLGEGLTAGRLSPVLTMNLESRAEDET